ncbi:MULTISPECIES: pentapeptide repeat-containing protein [Bradyrhizobium]|uniref:pentapeptide repeat-containing protein n=1 Tax=Bradyrhizobium TaxID=374 RepID=UPI00155E9A85|nr:MULTISPECIES: pentapeptide repeat-containing protein [Bradyrhizobium]UUO32540.1 pentapeptide repeat-containing protein [Bradyrhizobium sp. WBAH42]
MSDSIERLTQLRSASEGINSRAWLSIVGFATFAAYLLVIVEGTTDEQFILDRSIALPLININVGLVGFYILAPILLLFLHAYLLLTLVALSRRIAFLDDMIDHLAAPQSEREFQRLLGPSGPLVEATRSRRFSQWAMARTGLVATVAIMPLFVLTVMQCRFLPFHSVSATWCQRLILLLDVGLVAFFLRMTFRKMHPSVWIATSFVVGIPFIVFSTFVATVPHEFTEKFVLRHVPSSMRVPTEVPTAESYLFGLPLEGRNRDVFLPTYALFESPLSIVGMHRNLRLSGAKLLRSAPTESQEKALGAVDAWKRYGTGVDLTARDLRYADLRGTDLRGASLRGANLTGAWLPGADLSFANASGLPQNSADGCAGELASEGTRHGYVQVVPKNTCRTVFKYANLRGANLSRSDITHASFLASNLMDADLSGARGVGAEFDSSTLRDAKLVGADLSWSDMYGVFAENAIAIGVNLEFAALDAADLRGVQLQGARLSRSRFDTGLLDSASLDGADISQAMFRAARLRFVSLFGIVSDRETSFEAADLRGISSHLMYEETKAKLLEKIGPADRAAAEKIFEKIGKIEGAGIYAFEIVKTDNALVDHISTRSPDGSPSLERFPNSKGVVRDFKNEQRARVVEKMLLDDYQCDISNGIGIVHRLRVERREALVRWRTEKDIIAPPSAKLEDYLPPYVERVETAILNPAQCPTSDGLVDNIKRHADRIQF